jgi:hypothetical protein
MRIAKIWDRIYEVDSAWRSYEPPHRSELQKLGEQQAQFNQWLINQGMIKPGWICTPLHTNMSKASTQKPYRKAFLGLSRYFPVVPYSGKRSERAFLRDMTSVFVGRYMRAISLRRPLNCSESVVKITKAAKQEITMLKELTWQYVIENPALAAQLLVVFQVTL